MHEKAATPPSILCRDMSVDFTKIMEYILEIDPHLEPDYTFIESLMVRAAQRSHVKLDGIFDWEEAAASQIAHKEPPKNSKSDNMIVASKQDNSGLLIKIDAFD